MNQRDLLVIGIGNPLRGDDGIGWFVAESLANRSDVDALPAHQLMPELARTISKYSTIIFVDACFGCDDIEIEIASIESDSAAMLHSHSMSPHDVLQMSFLLFGSRPKAWIIHIPVTNCDQGHGMSDRSLSMANHALEWINSQTDLNVERNSG